MPFDWVRRAFAVKSRDCKTQSHRQSQHSRRSLSIEPLEHRLALAIVAGGAGSGNTSPPQDDPGYANIGHRGAASAIYLGNGWVLTATHVGAGATTFNGVTYNAVPGTSVQLLNPPTGTYTVNSDLTMYKIDGLPALPSLNIERSAPAVGWNVVMIGDGRDRLPSQYYWTSNWTPSATPSYYTGYTWTSSQSIRWGTNTITSVGLPVGVGPNSDYAFATTFTGTTAYDAQGATGDSGGGVFHKDAAGAWSLTGVMFSTNQYAGQPANTSVFGNVTFVADLSVYRTQIVALTGIADVLPTVSAGGPYTIYEGGSLTLDAAAVGTGEYLTYAWDINGDYIYADATGASPTLSWSQLIGLGLTDGPSTANVRVRVTDDAGGAKTSSPVTLTLQNVAPTAGISGPTAVQRNQSQVFTLSASDPSAIDQLAGFTFHINWGDGSAIQTVTGFSGTQVAHKFTTVGARTVIVTATDRNGGQSAAAIANLQVSAVQLLPNAQNAGLIDLVWTGVGGNDQVRFEQINATTVRVLTTLDTGTANNTVEIFNGITGRVLASGQGGDDTLDASGLASTKATLNGGSGNNILRGGGAGDILIGGANSSLSSIGFNMIVAGNGNNTIYGNDLTAQKGSVGGDNLIIGGSGKDTIYGNFGTNPTGDGGEGGQNLIIGGNGADYIYASQSVDGAEGGHGSIMVTGTTNLSELALISILAEWVSSDIAADRISSISGVPTGQNINGANYLIHGVTVFDDGVVDWICSDTKGTANWLFYSLSQDIAARVKPGDKVTNTG